MDPATQVARDCDVIRTESERLVALAQEHWETRVLTCPGWDLGHLLAHVGGALAFQAANAAAGGERASRKSVPGPPEGREQLIGWYDDAVAGLIDVLDQTDPMAPAWSWGGPATQHVWWWARRGAQEVSVHRWDGAHAVAGGAGPVTGFDPAVAAAGIDEHLCDFLPLWPRDRRGDLHGTLHVHTTDTPGEWFLDLDADKVETRREHAKADTAVRGPATEVLLWIWNRRAAADPVEVFGDRSVVENWTRIAI